MIDDKELNSRSPYLGTRAPRDRVGGAPVDLSTLPGPHMANAERRIAGSAAPESADGRRI